MTTQETDGTPPATAPDDLQRPSNPAIPRPDDAMPPGPENPAETPVPESYPPAVDEPPNSKAPGETPDKQQPGLPPPPDERPVG